VASPRCNISKGLYMNKEAAVIMGVITAILTLLNMTVTPEKYEAISYIVEAFILAGGFGIVRHFVYSHKTVARFLGLDEDGNDGHGAPERPE
jgi:hypothetical protein